MNKVALTLLMLAAPAIAIAQGASPRVERLIGEMTVDEKIGQLNQIPGGRSKALNSRLGNAEYERVRRGEVGSYLHVAGAEPLRRLQQVAVEQSRLKIPLLFAMDVVHGYRTIFPVPIALASSWDPAVHERAARVAAAEAAASGLHWTFAPMIDVARDPRWGRIVEGSGEDPYLGSVMAAAQVRGYQGRSLAAPDSVLATAKHFVGYGAATGGRDYDSADISERTLQEIYLPPFRAAADAGAGSFMTAFNDVGGVPMTAHQPLMRGVLRGGWGWHGLMVSDWNAIAELKNHGTAADDVQASAQALAASVDVDMASAAFATSLKAAVEREPALLPKLDEAVRRVLSAKEALGLFDTPYARHDPEREKRILLSPEHRAAAREAAARSIVLLKNDGGVLPIARAARRIAVVGALADDANSQLGSWRAQGKVEDVRPLLPALKAAIPYATVDFVAGASPTSEDTSGIPAAVQAARAADLVLLVVGEDFDLSGEARSRSDLALPGAQQALADAILDTGKPVAVILVNGRPLAIERLAERAPAILETWFLGVEAGPAMADVLTGRANPGGKLPVTFPRRTGAAPHYYNNYPTGRPADPDLAKDSARYRDLPITPLFPFGHGLSYARFDYSDFAVSGLRASVTVRNSGPVAGDEVVQLYMRDPVASVARPVKELRGFRRISLRPGEAKRVHFTLVPEQFALWDEQGWRVEPGAIELMIGSSSADIRGRASITIAAAMATNRPAASILTQTEVEPAR